jgi:hypothetical protein
MGKSLLPAYANYARAVAAVGGACPTLAAFSAALKGDGRLSLLRCLARAELQRLYDAIRPPFGLPAIPVYLPVRKKVQVAGRANALGGMPTEIRVYPIHGPPGKDYASWQPCDLRIDSEEWVFETLLHESAHVLEATRHGLMGHEHAFVAAYCDIESHLVALGMVKAAGAPLRFSGCPPTSHAATHCGRPRKVRRAAGARR